MDTPQEGQAPNPAANLPLNPDLMGYPTVEALVNAKRASDQEAQRIVAERDALKNQLAQAYRAPENPRQEVKQRGTASDRLAEYGVPVDALSEYVRSELQTAFEPIARGITARNTVMAEYPDYNKFESDVAQFIQSNPDTSQTYQRLFAADPVGAFEYAFLKFGESRRRSIPSNADAIASEAAAHAGIPSSRNGEARREDLNAQSDTQKAWEAWQRTGSKADAERYARARLHKVVPEEFLRQ